MKSYRKRDKNDEAKEKQRETDIQSDKEEKKDNNSFLINFQSS